MSGLPKKKVYLYDQNRKYIRNYDSISDFARDNNLDENIFSNRGRTIEDVLQFKNLDDELYTAALYKIGRDGIIKYERYIKSEYTKIYRGRLISENILKKKNENGKINVYNLDNELIMSFKNLYFCKKVLNTKYIQLNKGYNDSGLRFEIEEN